MKSKVCKGPCGQKKPLSNFPLTGKGYRRGLCRPCQRLRFNNWRRGHPRSAESKRLRLEQIRSACEATFPRYIQRCLRLIRKDDKKGKREFSIDLEFVLGLLENQEQKCAVTGLIMTHKRHDLRSVSIDRIDSKKGHTRDNIQLVCRFINLGKGPRPDSEIRACIEEIRAQGPQP